MTLKRATEKLQGSKLKLESALTAITQVMTEMQKTFQRQLKKTRKRLESKYKVRDLEADYARKLDEYFAARNKTSNRRK